MLVIAPKPLLSLPYPNKPTCVAPKDWSKRWHVRNVDEVGLHLELELLDTRDELSLWLGSFDVDGLNELGENRLDKLAVLRFIRVDYIPKELLNSLELVLDHEKENQFRAIASVCVIQWHVDKALNDHNEMLEKFGK